jgi:DNA mismatch repair protein MutS2
VALTASDCTPAYTWCVDGHALAVLEFPAIVERVAAAAATPVGAARARALVPSPDPEEVTRRQALTAEAVALLDRSAEPSLHGVEDVRDAVAHAARDGMLDTRSLRNVAATVGAALAARASLAGEAELAPLLADRAELIDPALASLADAISSCVEDDGSDLRDTASPALRRLRSRLRDGRHRVADELRQLARSSELREHLQEDFVTERGGRPVLAVRASARSSVPGIVHDASSSGQTLFVEPFAVVELNNQLAEAASAERDEVERILRDLSERVGAQADPLLAAVEVAGEIDLALALGSVSRAWRGAPVERSEEVRLIGARHPLLPAASAVPIDLDLGALRAVVISGPNTGGKTAALKTLGLAALLHQSGLRPPAAEAALPVFERVLADIGDEQSIEMNLSTFSGHVSNLVEILRDATERSLVLVDELASGTDPVEGSALAQALLARLAGQARLTVVTTHYPELKEWASATEEVANAATALDPETHTPLYRIALGRSGISHALPTAQRLGVDSDVIADARGRFVPERLRIAELLAEAEAAEQAAAAARAAAEEELAAAALAAERGREREAALEEERRAVRASAAEERARAVNAVRAELASARAELEGLRAEIRAARRLEGTRSRASSEASESAARERDRRLGAASERARRAEASLTELEPVAAAGPLAPGDPVEAAAVGVRGTIAAIEGDEAEVVGPGGLRVRIPLARLRPDARRDREPEPDAAPAVRVVASGPADVPEELDVRGRRAQEAREAVRSFVDDAALAGRPLVRIVHGRGTGAVRAAVREELARHPLVDGQESDSADGATVVQLGLR